MKRRPYEVTLVLRILSNEDEMNAALDQCVRWIENGEGDDADGKVTKIDRNRFGRRKLAYEIDGQRDAQYVYIEAEINPEHLTELELNYRLFDPLLRHLVVRAES